MSISYTTMQPPSGTTPMQVHMPDGTVVFPSANGQIQVQPQFVSTMTAAGWSVVVTSGTTHVP